MVLPHPNNARNAQGLRGTMAYHSLALPSALCDMSVVPGARFVVFLDDSPGL